MSRFDFLQLNSIDPTLEMNTEDYTTGVGGLCLRMKAGAALNIGDIVYWSAAFTVNKSTSAGLGKPAGVVIGGNYMDLDRTLRPRLRSADIGKQAAAINGIVLICVKGVVPVVADTSTILVGSLLKQSAVTAGRAALGAVLTGSAANPTQATTTATQTGDSVNAGAVAVTSTAANGAIITAGAITVVNGAITAGAVTLAGDSAGTVIGRALQASSVAGTVIYAMINVQ